MRRRSKAERHVDEMQKTISDIIYGQPDDLVTRLRAGIHTSVVPLALTNEAADRIEQLESLFPAILEYLENQADVVDGDNGIPAPNIAMSLLVWTKHALEGK